MPALTTTKIEKYKPTKNTEVLSDGNGLSVRFRKSQSGVVSMNWLYTYRVGSQSNYITIGEYNEFLSDIDAKIFEMPPATKLSLANARLIALFFKSLRDRGLDPKEYIQTEKDRLPIERQRLIDEELAQQKEAEQKAKELLRQNLTVKDMFDAWIIDGVRRKDGNEVLHRTFNKDVFPVIGNIPIKDITEHELRSVLRQMVARGVNRTAVLMRNSLAQMFSWAEKRQPWRKLLAEGNPMDLIEIKYIVGPDYDMDNLRNRRLSESEIFELSNIFKEKQSAFDNAPNRRSCERPISIALQCAIWIQLSTICRSGEMLMARWEHVDFEKGEWYIPRENVKDNVNEMMVYLSPFALNQFKLLFGETGDTEWCFPARHKINEHVCIKSMAKQVGDRQSMFKKGNDGEPRKPMKNRRHDNSFVLGCGKDGAWTPHDLRRTGSSMMQALGIPNDVINKCQNHVFAGMSKVDRHYLLHAFKNEKKSAWVVLGKKLTEIFNNEFNASTSEE